MRKNKIFITIVVVILVVSLLPFSSMFLNTFSNDEEHFIVPIVSNPEGIYSPPTVKPGDVEKKLGLIKPDYGALIILAIVVVAVIAVTPHVSSFAGKVFGGPADRLVKSLKNRRGRGYRRR